MIWRLRHLWFEAILRFPHARVRACRKFVPNHFGTDLPGVYCRVCGYDVDLHRKRRKTD